MPKDGSLRQRLAEQVHDSVAAAKRLRRGPLGLGTLPTHRLDAQRLPGADRVSRQRRNLIALSRQLADKSATDVARGPCDRDFHEPIAARSTVGCSGWGSSSPAATSLTALATAPLTSRLKTLGMM